MARLDEDARSAVDAARDGVPADGEGRRVVFGFDGYVDRVREVVADRQDPEHYDRLDTLAGLGYRVQRSVDADSSLSLEWFQSGTRTGGNVSHQARIYGGWGFDPVMFGNFGRPERDPFAEEFGDYERYSLGEPGITDAIEFDDGKLMLTDIGDTMSLDWETLTERVDRDRLVDRLDGSDLFGVGYWSETPDLPDVIANLAEQWSGLDDPPETVFLDPGDVRKLDRDRLQAGREAIGRLDAHSRFVVTANRAETRRFAETFAGTERDDQVANAEAVFDAIDASVFVSHGVEQSVAVSADGTSAVPVPAVDDPVLTTSSGDHFNAGFALALVEGLDPGAAAAMGNAVAGRFVRTGESPSLESVRAVLADYADLF